MTSYKLSLHSHTTNFVHFILSRPNKKKYVERLLKIIFKKRGNLVLGISNFNDDKRYQKLLEVFYQTNTQYHLDDTNKDFFFSIKKGNKKIYFVKTDEIETDKGHILIIGFRGNIKKRSLNDVLKEAHKQKCVIIANHPPHNEFLTSYFLIKRLNSNREISLNEKELLKHKRDFDALELNSYFPEDWKKIKRFASKNNLRLVSDSDAHFLDEIFISWYKLNDLSFKNPLSFKRSLKQGLKKKFHLHAMKHGYAAKYKHILEVILERIGRKVGVLEV